MATRSECEREAREAAVNLVLSTAHPHSVRMGTRVLETLDDMRDILSYHSVGCKQALPIFEELVKAGQEPAGEDYPATNLEHRLVEWLDRREAAPDTPPVKPQSPRQPIYLNLKRKASESEPEKPEPEKPEPQVTTFLLPRAAEPQDEDFMRNKAAPVFHSSNHVLVPCEFRHTGPGVSEAELLECLYRVGDDKYQGKGCAWMAWRLVGQAQPPDVGHHAVLKRGKLVGLLPQAHHEAAAPSSGVHPALQAWQGEASRCREADGQLLGAEGDHAGHESGRVRRPCCSKRTSGARVLPTTGFEELRRYDDVRVPEPSHQARHDLPRRQGLEHRQAQSRALLQLRKQLQDDQLQTESLLVSRHRQLLMTDFVINESTVNCWWYNPKVHQKQPLDFFEAYGRSEGL